MEDWSEPQPSVEAEFLPAPEGAIAPKQTPTVDFKSYETSVYKPTVLQVVPDKIQHIPSRFLQIVEKR